MPKMLLITRNRVFFAVFALIVLGVLVLLCAKTHHQASQIENLQKQVGKLDERISLARHDLYSSNYTNHVVADKDGKYVYMPELRIKMPFSSLARSITYGIRGEDDPYNDSDPIQSGEVDVSSTAYQYPERELTLNCGILVRLKIENKQHPYNPSEKPHTVKLADGRNLQVYEFVNANECQDSWDSSINPGQIVDIFKKAESY
ncbi:hypothetical protein KDA23_04985 [Candidatus Saccharibacteria bacterium]|nr:hypothetical protein [Candidatus Saccharibacteria bacterium]